MRKELRQKAWDAVTALPPGEAMELILALRDHLLQDPEPGAYDATIPAPRWICP